MIGGLKIELVRYNMRFCMLPIMSMIQNSLEYGSLNPRIPCIVLKLQCTSEIAIILVSKSHRISIGPVYLLTKSCHQNHIKINYSSR